MRNRNSVFFFIIFSVLAGSSDLRAEAAADCPSFQEKVRKCMALHGTTEQRAQNQAWRNRHLPATIQEDHGFTLVYLDETVEKPIAAQMTGVRLLRVLSEQELQREAKCGAAPGELATTGEAGKLWAEVRLPDRFQELCGLSVSYVQVDDHLGAQNQIISVFPQGMLLKSGTGLFWISLQPATFFPEFRMVWQSSYRVAPTISHSSTGSKKPARKRSPRRKSASKRKKR